MQYPRILESGRISSDCPFCKTECFTAYKLPNGNLEWSCNKCTSTFSSRDLEPVKEIDNREAIIAKLLKVGANEVVKITKGNARFIEENLREVLREV